MKTFFEDVVEFIVFTKLPFSEAGIAAAAKTAGITAEFIEIAEEV